MRRVRQPKKSSRPPLRLRMVVLGVQGSGKGTQAELVARRFGLAHISTGEIFRREISRRTALGRRAERYLMAGKLVPDAVTNAIVGKHLRFGRARTHGFVLDGYPRNRAQLTALERATPVTHAIQILLPDRVAVQRISGRLNCACGLSYHVQYHPPRRRGICDRCGRKLFVRDDDQPATIRKRIRIYHRQTAPLLAYYRKRGVLLQVDGRPAIAAVFRRVLTQLRRSMATP
ncbi:MAG: nucleoside monophosphate kinase [Patescibacteria group bacterium]|nr:nucleoside monophosphate kinase [Patescibacteria group bacterium]